MNKWMSELRAQVEFILIEDKDSKLLSYELEFLNITTEQNKSVNINKSLNL